MTDTLGRQEGDDGEDHTVPGDLLELYEVLEWEAATAGQEAGDDDRSW